MSLKITTQACFRGRLGVTVSKETEKLWPHCGKGSIRAQLDMVKLVFVNANWHSSVRFCTARCPGGKSPYVCICQLAINIGEGMII